MIATGSMANLLLLLLSVPAPIMAFTPPSSSTVAFSRSTGAAARLTNQNVYGVDKNMRKNLSSLNALKEATFGMGCFWEPAESLLNNNPGILATTVGYTGAAPPSNKPPPSYDTVCFGNDYVEAVRVVYDDSILSYTALLDDFFKCQKPGLGRQYASVIFVDDSSTSSGNVGNGSGKNEQEQAMEWKTNAIKTNLQQRPTTTTDKKLSPYEIVEIEPLTKFYRAESYHQRYWHKQRVRAAIGAVLIAGVWGAFDDLGGGAVGNFELGDSGLGFDSVCNVVFLMGAGWMILERLVVRDVRELRSGDLIDELL